MGLGPKQRIAQDFLDAAFAYDRANPNSDDTELAKPASRMSALVKRARRSANLKPPAAGLQARLFGRGPRPERKRPFPVRNDL